MRSRQLRRAGTVQSAAAGAIAVGIGTPLPAAGLWNGAVVLHRKFQCAGSARRARCWSPHAMPLATCRRWRKVRPRPCAAGFGRRGREAEGQTRLAQHGHARCASAGGLSMGTGFSHGGWSPGGWYSMPGSVSRIQLAVPRGPVPGLDGEAGHARIDAAQSPLFEGADQRGSSLGQLLCHDFNAVHGQRPRRGIVVVQRHDSVFVLESRQSF